MWDLTYLPSAGGPVILAALYTVASLFVTGPIVGERMVAKSGWPQSCAASIRSQVEEGPARTQLRSGVNCKAVGALLGRDGVAFCEMYGSALGAQLGSLFGEIEAGKRQIDRARMEHAAGQAQTRCECAVTSALEKVRVPLAIHAGSIRLITPAPVKTLQSELISALNTPLCAMKG